MKTRKEWALDTGTVEGRIEAMQLIVVGMEGKIRELEGGMERMEGAIENLPEYLQGELGKTQCAPWSD